jgi:hypothetical protein
VAVTFQALEMLRVHELVVEGCHVAAADEAGQRSVRIGRTERHVAGDQRRAVIWSLGEQLERDAKRDRRLVGHPR